MRFPFSERRLPFLQDLIHRFEEEGGIRYLRWVVAVLLLLILVAAYNLRAFRNFGTQEAMDTAQLARNLSEGRGYSTSFIRPFSIYLVQKRNQEPLVQKRTHERIAALKEKLSPIEGNTNAPAVAEAKAIQAEITKLGDSACIKGSHPDISNPPVYPVLLAGLMKVLPFDYTAHTNKRFWSRNGIFYRYQPDFLISLFNQCLFLLIVFLVFRLARRLFDREVAWVSALALLGTELLWRFSVSGLSTMLLMLGMVGLAWALVLREEWGREEACGTARLMLLGCAIGILVGLGALTRYSFGFVILPVLLFLIFFSGRARAQTILCAAFGFALVLVPWVLRNYSVSGAAFGTASYALIENTTDILSGNRLERSLQPNLFVPAFMRVMLAKLFGNLRLIVESDLPKLGGTWISAFFLVGFMVGFKREGPRKLRYFLLACIPVFILVQAFGRTHLSEDSPVLNTENLLVLLTPFAVVFGVSLFFLLLDQVQVPALELRYVIVGLFLVVACLPMLLVFCPPKTYPHNPPYIPAFIQVVTSEVKEKELTMSDIPWAMAWYGKRDCVWLTLRPLPPGNEPSKEDLLAVNDYLKPISALYLSPITIDRKLVSGDTGWTEFVQTILVNRELPPPEKKFPLTTSLQSMDFIRRGHLVLMAWDPRLRGTAK